MMRRLIIALAALPALSLPAAAHHPMGGKLPTTALEGLLSGLGHPVIGPDHLAFIIAIGIAAAIVPGGIGLIGAFLAASAAGVLAHVGDDSRTLVRGRLAYLVVRGRLAHLVVRGRLARWRLARVSGRN